MRPGINQHLLTGGEGGEHAQRGACNAVHACQAAGAIDGHGDHEGWDDAALVAQGQAKDDVCGGAGAAGVSNVLGEGKERRGSVQGREDVGGKNLTFQP